MRHVRICESFPYFYVPNRLPRRFDLKPLNFKQVYMGFLACLEKYTDCIQRKLSINHNFACILRYFKMIELFHEWMLYNNYVML